MRERYETARERIKNDDDVSDKERELILEFLDANDPRRNTYKMPDGKTKQGGTLTRYAKGALSSGARSGAGPNRSDGIRH
jgi:hypothetical protein